MTVVGGGLNLGHVMLLQPAALGPSHNSTGGPSSRGARSVVAADNEPAEQE